MPRISRLSSFFAITLLTLALFISGSYGTPIAAALNPHIVEDLAYSAEFQVPQLKHARSIEDTLVKRKGPPYQSVGARQGIFAITGIQDGLPAQPRIEIRDLRKKPDQWNIFLLALDRMMKTDQSNEFSYYQISGIHGLPLVAWNGVAGTSSDADNPGKMGYCYHSSNLFGTWHRPYLALFEQILNYNALDIASEFNDTARWQTAAQQLRLPYWDWAMAPPAGESSFPPSFQTPIVTVLQPNGTSQTINNPLYSYKFQGPAKDLYYYPWTAQSETLRSPTTTDPTAVSQNSVSAGNLDAQRINLRDRVYNLLSQYTNYSQFSNEAWINGQATGGSYDSIESVHDNIHNAVGGPNLGYMTYLGVSAFDPSFWFHHVMVDRVVALWQALHPDSWVEPQAQVGANYMTKKGDILDANSPLWPFHSTYKGDFWTSNTARNLSTFSYTYPELAPGANTDSIKAAINALYAPTTAPVAKRAAAVPAQRHYEWLANIRIEKMAGQGKLSIYVFMGGFNNNPSAWLTDPSNVGMQPILANLNSPALSPMEVTGSIPLTTFLVKKVNDGTLKSLAPEDITQYMKDNLAWRVAQADGTELPLTQYPNLKVSIVSFEVEPAKSPTDFPKWVGTETVHDDITADKLGGHNAGDPL